MVLNGISGIIALAVILFLTTSGTHPSLASPPKEKLFFTLKQFKMKQLRAFSLGLFYNSVNDSKLYWANWKDFNSVRPMRFYLKLKFIPELIWVNSTSPLTSVVLVTQEPSVFVKIVPNWVSFFVPLDCATVLPELAFSGANPETLFYSSLMIQYLEKTKIYFWFNTSEIIKTVTQKENR